MFECLDNQSSDNPGFTVVELFLVLQLKSSVKPSILCSQYMYIHVQDKHSQTEQVWSVRLKGSGSPPQAIYQLLLASSREVSPCLLAPKCLTYIGPFSSQHYTITTANWPHQYSIFKYTCTFIYVQCISLTCMHVCVFVFKIHSRTDRNILHTCSNKHQLKFLTYKPNMMRRNLT